MVIVVVAVVVVVGVVVVVLDVRIPSIVHVSYIHALGTDSNPSRW